MGILSKWFGKSQESVDVLTNRPMGEKYYFTRKPNDIIIHVKANDGVVAFNVEGLEDLNVCLASFITKGVSYAQEKYNEYQANKDTDAIVEEPKAEKPRREIVRPTQREIEKLKAWAKAEQAKRESK